MLGPARSSAVVEKACHAITEANASVYVLLFTDFSCLRTYRRLNNICFHAESVRNIAYITYAYMRMHAALTSVPIMLFTEDHLTNRMWANAQRDGRPDEHRWRPLFNAAKFGCRPLPDAGQ